MPEPQFHSSDDDMEFLETITELVFVVVEGEGKSKVAIEAHYGMIAFGADLEQLQAAIVHNVQEHFKGKFKGTARIRQFIDTVIKI